MAIHASNVFISHPLLRSQIQHMNISKLIFHTYCLYISNITVPQAARMQHALHPCTNNYIFNRSLWLVIIAVNTTILAVVIFLEPEQNLEVLREVGEAVARGT